MPVWVSKSVVLAIHDAQLAEHGGLAGMRDENALDSALARPVNLAAYGPAGILELAAAYAFGLSRNHPFTDGNKRVSFVVTDLFLLLNGVPLIATDEEIVLAWTAIADGAMTEAVIADWLRTRTER